MPKGQRSRREEEAGTAEWSRRVVRGGGGKRRYRPDGQKRGCYHKECNFEERQRYSKGVFRDFSFVMDSVIPSH